MTAQLIFYLLIGHLIASRTVHLLKIANIVAVENENWLRCLYLMTPIMLLLLMRIGHTNMFWLFAFVFFALPFMVAEFIERRRTRQFVSETRDFYDELLFEIRSGNSLRSSLDRIIASQHFGFYTREMVGVALKNNEETVSKREARPPSTSSTRNKITQQRLLELRRLLCASGKILERLQFLRHIHHLEQKFRRRSRIATQQVRAQAAIVLILYVGLLILQLVTGFTKLDSPFVFVSLSLILAGLGTIYHITRSFRWKV